MTKSKFPKAFAAVGLATVLVGCGGGSSTVEMVSTDSSEDTTDEPVVMAPPVPSTPSTAEDTTDEPVVMAPPVPSTPSPAEPDPMAEAKAAVENALATSESRIDALGNYSTDEQFSVAEDGLDNILKLLAEDTNISVADKEAFDEKYLQLRAEFDNREEMKGELMTKNDEATKLITAIGKWDNDIMSTIDLNLKQTNIMSPMYSDVINSDKMGSTTIRYRTSTDPDVFATDDVLARGTMIEDLPEGWEGKSFITHTNTDRQEHLKIFTDRMEPSETYAGKWEEFWGTTNNSGTVDAPTDSRATSAGKSKYFEEGYYAHAFGSSNVDILRGANNPDTTDIAAAGEVIIIMEGGPSAMHYTDLFITGEDLTKMSLKIGTADVTLPSFVTLFGRPVNLACTVLDGDDAAVTNGGGCEVDLSLEGFLEVKHSKLNSLGEADEDNVTDETLADENITARLTLTTNERRTDLKDVEIDITRPDTDYKVMGYWIDKHGTAADAFNIDTFATARYGPAGETGITDNIGRLEGEATYTGDSFGAYVMNKGDGDNMDLYDGEFKATVTLNANFMDPNRRSNANAFTVDGMIENFESLTRTEDDLTAWTLELSGATARNPDGSFSGATTGGGKWQGQFYGMGGMDTPDEEGDDHPVAAVGDFSGDFGNYNRVVGVFGADKMEE